eukprot:2110359-Rhodomonas_salina.1
MEKKRAVSNVLHAHTGFRNMEEIEQTYPCGGRLRGCLANIIRVLRDRGLTRTQGGREDSAATALPVMTQHGTDDWTLGAAMMKQATWLLDMVDWLQDTTVQATQVLEKTWLMKSDDDCLAGLEYFTQSLSYARQSRCGRCGGKQKIPLSGTLSNTPEVRTFWTDCMHFTMVVCREEDYADTAFLEPAFSFGTVPSNSPLRLRGVITAEQQGTYISQVRAGKAVGFDSFHAEFLHAAPLAFVNLLHYWINLLLEGTVQIDKYWLLSQIKLLFKGKEPATWLKHWQPICLLKLMYRLYSLILNDRLKEIVERHNFLEGSQEGFRAGKGTGRQARSLAWIYAEARRKGLKLFMIFAAFI